VPLEIPPEHMVWGLVRNKAELAENSISLEKLSEIKSIYSQGKMCFEGNGAMFVEAFKERIHHILHANGAFYKNWEHAGHAQKNQRLSLNTIQPFQFGVKEGMYPNIKIQP
jgi:hypothetical protein